MCFVKYLNRGVCGLICLWKLIILFPPAKYDFNNPVSLNVFASKAITNAVILGSLAMFDKLLSTVLSERQFRFSKSNNTFPRSKVKGPPKSISLLHRIN